jgi:hypothetical protein
MTEIPLPENAEASRAERFWRGFVSGTLYMLVAICLVPVAAWFRGLGVERVIEATVIIAGLSVAWGVAVGLDVAFSRQRHL